MYRTLKNLILLLLAVYLTACASSNDVLEAPHESNSPATTQPASNSQKCDKSNGAAPIPSDEQCKNNKAIGDPDTLD